MMHGETDHYTVSISGPGDLLPRFEQVLDHLPAGAIVGDETGATLLFDVLAHDDDEAVEWAWLRAQGVLRVDDDVFITVSPAEPDEPLSWWRRMLRIF